MQFQFSSTIGNIYQQKIKQEDQIKRQSPPYTLRCKLRLGRQKLSSYPFQAKLLPPLRKHEMQVLIINQNPKIPTSCTSTPAQCNINKKINTPNQQIPPVQLFQIQKIKIQRYQIIINSSRIEHRRQTHACTSQKNKNENGSEYVCIVYLDGDLAIALGPLELLDPLLHDLL